MAIDLVTALPSYISPEEHKDVSTSTPASFADIPPVLRHKQENVSVTLDPPLDGFTGDDGAGGTLYVIERCFRFHPAESLSWLTIFTSILVFLSATGRGFQVDYPSITLHAISRAAAGPSIYCQLDDPPVADATNHDEEDASKMRELVILPKDPSSRTLCFFSYLPKRSSSCPVELIFESLSLCASLHPDPNEEDEMDDDDDAFVDPGEFETFEGDAGQELSEVGKVRSDLLNNSRFNPY